VRQEEPKERYELSTNQSKTTGKKKGNDRQEGGKIWGEMNDETGEGTVVTHCFGYFELGTFPGEPGKGGREEGEKGKLPFCTSALYKNIS